MHRQFTVSHFCPNSNSPVEPPDQSIEAKHRFSPMSTAFFPIVPTSSCNSLQQELCGKRQAYCFLSSNNLCVVNCRQWKDFRSRSMAVRASVDTSSSVSFDESKVNSFLDSLKWDDKGLVVAIAQNVDTGAILMQGFANKDALAMTITTRKATFYSRSRSSLWTKGETSTNFIHVHDIFIDCDRDSVIYIGKPDGPSCHTGSETCYYYSVLDVLKNSEATEQRLASTTLYALEDTIAQRRDEILNNGKPSWTKRLLDNTGLLCSKVREEAEELVQTLLENEDRSRTASEMADLLYHSMVLLSSRHVKVEEVLDVLRKRFSQSGIEEKISRKKPVDLS